MMYKSLVLLTVLPMALLSLWNAASPDSFSFDNSGSYISSTTYQISEATPTPSPTPTETTPIQTPTRQREPGLVAGAIIIGVIIIFGVLRYSRLK